MNLATRCTDCGTVFRVVPDQLKVSEGWVRCGRCNAVFNAEEHLVDLEATDSGAAPAPDEATAPSTPPPTSPEPHRLAPDIGLSGPAIGNPTRPGGVASIEADTADGQPATPSAVGSGAHAPLVPHVTGEFVLPVADEAASATAVSAADPAVRIDAEEALPTPSFLRDAPDRGRTGSRARRLVNAGLAAVLAMTLIAQLALGWRDELAARAPALREVLAALCEPFGCSISAPRRIAQLVVESSGLARIDGAAVHRLTVALRNRADTAALAPAIELTLTDVQGSLIARKVIAVTEFGQTARSIDPGAELALQALVSTGDRRVAGYAVEIFYP